ncbi:TonB family protein [Phormidium sp. CLA17]|uniref:TonB family protein n=1 Tax=Leptolyngbya sp. Cla-17 TaxID=2803751 RepID=UPI001490C0EA|nr:TonB family protein [Leptolyngbya sp. Cla-17]MBM0743664.1 TonB family protein [Leptolyngbya sp. Cla-17]
MSSSLPKSFPALFDSGNIGKTGALLMQPTSLAVLASFGVHGLLWFGLPLMSASEPQQSDTQRSVPLVELSPLEQARLPQISSSTQLNLPKQSTVPGSLLPNSLALEPINPQTPQDSTSYYNVPSETAAPTVFPYSVAPLSKRSLRKSAAEANLDSETKAQSSAKDTEKQTEQEGQETSEPPISSKAEDLLASKQQDDQGKIALQQKYAYSTENTSPDDFGNNSKTLSETAEAVSKGDIRRDWEKLDTMTAPYPKDACQFKHEGKTIAGEAWVGVVVQPNGELATKPTLLRSSGFKGLDEAATEFIAKYSFESSKQYRGFYVPIKLEFSKTDCVTADTTNSAS